MQEKGVKIMVVSLYSMTSKLLKTTADQYLDLEKIKKQIVYDDCNLVA